MPSVYFLMIEVSDKLCSINFHIYEYKILNFSFGEDVFDNDKIVLVLKRSRKEKSIFKVEKERKIEIGCLLGQQQFSEFLVSNGYGYFPVPNSIGSYMILLLEILIQFCRPTPRFS